MSGTGIANVKNMKILMVINPCSTPDGVYVSMKSAARDDDRTSDMSFSPSFTHRSIGNRRRDSCTCRERGNGFLFYYLQGYLRHTQPLPKRCHLASLPPTMCG